MELPSIDKIIEKLVRNHETRDPYQIASRLGIQVIEEDLGEIYGYYNKLKRKKFLHINCRLGSLDKKITCSHELGHGVLHPNENTPMLSKQTIVSELKIEKEANYFATKLIVDNSHNEFNLLSKYDILHFYGLPDSFERYL